MESFKDGTLEIAIENMEDSVLMSWKGVSDSRNPSGFLNPYFEKLIEEMKNLTLVIEFKDLEYMNSSTIPPIIRLLKNLDSNEIATTIVYDINSTWQEVSFKALKTISTMLPRITVEGK